VTAAEPDGWGYVVMWEFRVRLEMVERFENAYGQNGQWARLFTPAEGYLATELVRDVQAAGRYVTLDFWKSREAYEDFRERHQAEYKAVDLECEALTESEVELGAFVRARL
jgi:heme-degrading monooxygenase HmoA